MQNTKSKSSRLTQQFENVSHLETRNKSAHDVDSNVAADRHLGVGGLQPDSNPAEDKPVGKAAAEDKLVGKAAVEERVVAEDTAVEDTVVDMAVEDKAAENSPCFLRKKMMETAELLRDWRCK